MACTPSATLWVYVPRTPVCQQAVRLGMLCRYPPRKWNARCSCFVSKAEQKALATTVAMDAAGFEPATETAFLTQYRLRYVSLRTMRWIKTIASLCLNLPKKNLLQLWPWTRQDSNLRPRRPSTRNTDCATCPCILCSGSKLLHLSA